MYKCALENVMLFEDFLTIGSSGSFAHLFFT